MALDTVSDYVVSARRLLLDEVEPYRYPTADLVDALNMGILEARKIRPDLFLANFRGALPMYWPNQLNASVEIDPMYRVPFVYYMVGMVQLRDDEATQDQRASGFLATFESKLRA